MNAIDGDQKPIAITGLNGLWSRGAGETCPPDHFQICNNCIFPGRNQVSIREQISYLFSHTGGTIISYAVCSLATENILLTLNSSGAFRDETNNVQLTTISGADDFCALSLGGRIYISFKSSGKALTAPLYYYDGTYFLQAACSTYSGAGTLHLALSGAGNVGPGTYTFGIAYLFSTGFISFPIETNTVVADGAHSISITAIPTAPAGYNVVGRVILVSQANQTQLFFYPGSVTSFPSGNTYIGGIIKNNTDTSTSVNFYDTSLIASANYLTTEFVTIPGGSALRTYHGRLVVIGNYQYPDIILVSNPLAYDTIDQINGLVNLPVDYGYNTTDTAAIIRDVMYAMKPNGCYAVTDNGGLPATWPVTVVDTGLGCFDNGLSVFASSASAQDVLDQCMVVSERGLLLFNGTFQDPPLSYKIEGLWQTIDRTNFFKAQIAHDTIKKRIYLALPLPGGLSQQLLMGDYTEGLSPNTIKWSTWSTESWSTTPLTKLAMYSFPFQSYFVYLLSFCNGGASIYNWASSAGTPSSPQQGDLGTNDISQVVQTANLSFGQGISLFTLLDISMAGVGLVTLALQSKRNEATVIPTGFNLTYYNPTFTSISGYQANAGSDLYRGINFLSEAMSIELSTNSVSSPLTYTNLVSFFQLTGIDVYGKVMYKIRPTMVQTK